MILSRSLPRIRRSARAFARAPGLSFALLLTIALGVGSNAAVYGFLQGLTHPASALRDSDGIVSIFRHDRSRDAGPLSPGEYQQLENSHEQFEWVGAMRIETADTMIGGQPQIATVAAVTPSLAAALAIPLNKGVVISHRIRESDFDGKENAVGSTVRIGNAEFRIQGVAPDQLAGLYSDQNVDLWVRSSGKNLEGSDRRDLWVLARLRHGVSISQAQAALRSSSSRLAEMSVTAFTGIPPDRARGLARVGMFLNFSAGAVFFIACLNVASFLLGRALRRSHETSLRIALGATRAELLWELFADSVVISVAGGVLGLLLGILTARALPAFLFAEDAERLSFAPHLLPILTAAMVCVVVTLLCGMMPVLGTVTDRPWTVLQRETGSPSKALLRLRSALVVGQITASCMLVISTALLFAGLHDALKTSAGERLGNPILLTVQAQIPRAGPEVDTSYFSEVERKAKSLAGLSPLAWTARPPGSRPTWRTFRVQKLSAPSRDVDLDIVGLTPEALQSLDNPSTAGRIFGINDQAYRVAVVNEAAAAQLFGQQTVGVVIRDPADLPVEIVGVIQSKLKNDPQERRPTLYYGYLDPSGVPSPVQDVRFRVPLAPPEAGIELNANAVSANYFVALGMPLIAGQKFSENRIPGQGRVAVVNQEAADHYFDGKPLGDGVIDDNGVRTEIIGVVRSQIFGTFEKHAEPTIYFPMSQDPAPRMTLILEPSKRSSGLAAALRLRIESLPGKAAPIAIKTLDAQLAQSSLAALRIATLIGGASAIIALMLSMLGLLSTQNDAERQRQRERALRIALGSQRWRIVLLVVKSAGRLALAGTLIGTFLSFVFLRLLMADIAAISSPAFQVWLIAPLLPAAAIIIASMIPARRASVASLATIMRDN